MNITTDSMMKVAAFSVLLAIACAYAPNGCAKESYARIGC